MSTTVDIPREFLPVLQREVDISVACAAGDLSVVGSDDFEPSLEALRRVLDCRDELLAADEHPVTSKLLMPVLDSTIRSLHYEIDEHDHKNLDDLARLVDLLRRMAAWADEHRLVEREEVAA